MSRSANQHGQTPPSTVVDTPKAKSWWASNVVVNSATAVGFIVTFVIFHFWLSAGFFIPDSRMLNVHQNVPILILALAAVVGLFSGAFDISIAAMATLSAFLTIGFNSLQGWPIWLTLPVVLLVGCLGGLLNGILVAYIRVNVIIATLGTGSLFLGISIAYSNGSTISSAFGEPLPEWFVAMGTYTAKLPGVLAWLVAIVTVAWVVYALVCSRFTFGFRNRRFRLAAVILVVVGLAAALYFFGNIGTWFSSVSWAVLSLAIITLGVHVFMMLTRSGRNLRAVGSNPVAARLAGVKVERVTVMAFCVVGMIAALAGIFLVANQGAAAPNVAGTFLLAAFAAAFLSTVILSPGLFTVWGTVIGGVFIVWVAQGLILAGVPFTWIDIVNGIILIIAVSLSSVLRRVNS